MSRSRRTLLSTLMICAATAGGTLPAARSLAAQIAPAAAGPDSGAFGALSPAGRRAMLDVSVARGALFDGRTDEAARLIHDARVRFDQARGDDTAILKPEAELVPSPDLRASASLVTLVSSTVPASHPFHEFHDARVVAWLPYDGEVVLRDAPEAGAMHEPHEPHDTADARRRKAAALAAANAALSGGRRTEALALLARAQVGVDCTLDIVPLDATVRRIGQADSLMRAGRYYEAGQMLHRIERSARRERVDLGAVAHAIPTRHAG
ncbi:YfdX family protein [Burkholderia plantarii]|uniref:YfdX family protein n=1 Tax=Burkholderia plantarii TaxID=41899 RepID=UPI0018DE60A4|nr:YfdX family protein [Burkholderia plantarii]MBI0330998.1 YfdX family protein [Burkholderia plantarii]